jgi:hypothetical protein
VWHWNFFVTLARSGSVGRVGSLGGIFDFGRGGDLVDDFFIIFIFGIVIKLS